MVWFPRGEKHWHGAAPTMAMTHMAIQEQLEGKAVGWLRMVLGSQALETTLATLRKRIASFEAQAELAASTDFPPGT